MQIKESSYLQKAIEIAIRLVIIFVMIAWCFEIIRPFVSVIVGGIILAVAAYPLFVFIKKKIKLTDGWTAIILTVISLIVIIVPCYLLLASLAKEFHVIAAELKNNKLGDLPPFIAQLPMIGKPITDTWTMASHNTPLLFQKYSTELHSIGTWLLAFALGLTSGILHLLVSIILAGVFLFYSKSGIEMSHKIFVRLAGTHGDDFSTVASRTIRNVTKGVLGVALIDSMLASIGFFIAGVPLAGIWTLGCFMFCVVQIGIVPIAVPIVAYLFYTGSTLAAILLGVWLLIIYLLDHLLKPLLLSKGAPVPMPVIFIGVIGGFIAAGFIGMFIGAVAFSIGYNLFKVWLENSVEKVAEEEGGQE